MSAATFFVSCKHHRRCDAFTEVASKAEQTRLQHVWACDRCAKGLTPIGQRSPRQRQYRAERQALKRARAVPALPLEAQLATASVLDAYAKGREEGFRAGYEARDAELRRDGVAA